MNERNTIMIAGYTCFVINEVTDPANITTRILYRGQQVFSTPELPDNQFVQLVKKNAKKILAKIERIDR